MAKKKDESKIIANGLQKGIRKMTNLFSIAQNRLRVKGGRMTNQRRMILEALDSLTTHPTAEELYCLVIKHDPTVNLSTVYRTLRWLQKEGLVKSRWFGDADHQERFDPAFAEEHHHFRCLECGKVIEFENPVIEKIQTQLEREVSVKVISTSFMLYGTCRRCTEGSEENLKKRI